MQTRIPQILSLILDSVADGKWYNCRNVSGYALIISVDPQMAYKGTEIDVPKCHSIPRSRFVCGARAGICAYTSHVTRCKIDL